MNTSIAKNTVACAALLIALLAVPMCIAHLTDDGICGFLRETIAQARGRYSFFDKAGNGYYEELMANKDFHASEQTAVWWLITTNAERHAALRGDIYRYRDSFLMHEPKPNLNLPNTVEGPVRTNSYGFFDDEHSLNKAPGVRRIVFLGDSITKGTEVDANARFSTLFANQLNSQLGNHFEILNFAIPAYHLTQTFDVELEKVPAFRPDVYVTVLTELAINSLWGDHVKRLVDANANLKYDFIRNVVDKAGLRKDEPQDLSLWKLAPYRESLTREILFRMKAHAEQQSAQFVVVLVPAVEGREENKIYSQMLDHYLQGLGISVVDLMDTFDHVDADTVRANWYDPHPNALGHQLIAENLYNKLRQNHEAWAAITGIPEQPTELNSKLTAVKNTPVTHNLMTREAH